MGELAKLSRRAGRCLVLTGAIALACGETESETESESGSSGSSGSSGGGGGSVASFDAVLQELAASVCRGACDDTDTTYLEVTYGAECLEIYTLLYQALTAVIQRSLDAGTIRFDAEEGQRCVDALRDDACDELERSCEGIFVGQLAIGEACTNSTECTGNAYCSDELECPGTCVATLGAGEACPGADFDECGDGFFCSAEAVCSAEKANGEPCDYDEECSSYHCDYDDGSRCTETPDEYTQELGGPCDYDGQCEPDLYCQDGTCAPAARVGEACLGVPCARDAYCTQESDGICLARIPLGEACETSRQCATNICDGGVCEKHSGFGEPCVTDDRCFGVCDDGACAPYPACEE